MSFRTSNGKHCVYATGSGKEAMEVLLQDMEHAGSLRHVCTDPADGTKIYEVLSLLEWIANVAAEVEPPAG